MTQRDGAVNMAVSGIPIVGSGGSPGPAADRIAELETILKIAELAIDAGFAIW